MAPNNEPVMTGYLFENDVKPDSSKIVPIAIAPPKSQVYMKWYNLFFFIYLHAAAVYGLYLCFTTTKWSTIAFAGVLHYLGMLGTTAGVHRLWSHRTYKATTPLRIFLMLCQTLAYQDPVFKWARDHRTHHKYSETAADPHNTHRGFFYAHIGWLLCSKDPLVTEKGSQVDMSDVYADPVLKFQKKYYYPLVAALTFILPTVVPWYCWHESAIDAFFVAAILKFIVTLNISFMVNSVAHKWGNKPYDKHINPSENLLLSFLAIGEGWHNYHHVFPWDYKTSEFSNYMLNSTTIFLDVCAKLGLAYDLKTVSMDVIRARMKRTGDPLAFGAGENIWGWGDKDQSQEEKDMAITVAAKTM